MGAWSLGTADPQGSEITPEHVAGPIHMLTGNGGNLGVSVGPDGVLLIDDQFADMAKKIQGAIDQLAQDAGLDGGSARFLINTHHHGDHTGGNEIFGVQSTIVAHENVREQLLNRERGGAMPAVGLPVVTYSDGLSLHFNGEEIRLVHLPEGHTNGDTVVFFTGSNVVHTGDLCFNGMFPFIDLDGGGSVLGYIKNVDEILTQTDAKTRFIPGHGKLASREDLQTLSTTLSTIVQLVAGAKQDGQTAVQMKSGKLLAEFESWNWQFVNADQMIDTVLRELGSE